MKNGVVTDKKQKRMIVTPMARMALTLIFVALFFQIAQGAILIPDATKNVTRVIRINPPRGTFYDRNGKLLVSNRISRDVMVIPDDVKSRPEVLRLLSGLLKIPLSDLQARLKSNPRIIDQYIMLKKGLDPKSLVQFSANMKKLSGIEIVPNSLRTYGNGEFACHLFGYIGKINSRELVSFKNSGYRSGDIIGKSGLERTYEQYLHGTVGTISYEVNMSHHPLRRLETTDPQPGNNLYLTLDYKIQLAAEKALDEQFKFAQEKTEFKNGKSGLAIALDPRNGDVLAMVSKPGFNPNLFANTISPQMAQQLYSNPLNPFINRVLQGEFAPGSAFKPVTVLAALMEGKVTLEDQFFCNGYDPNPGFPKCWTVTNTTKVAMHGKQNIIDGIKNSCNLVMSELGRRIGPVTLAQYAREFGFGKPTGINLYPGEKTGLVPDPDWKRLHCPKDRVWHPAETGMFAIGQDALTVTPLQLAQLYAGIANNGQIYRPRLVSKITGYKGEQLVEFKPEVMTSINIPAEASKIVKTGMEKVIAPGGTAWEPFKGFPLNKYPVAGKTGTAQKPPYDNNGLFACFAPVDKPEIVVVVVIEQGGGGSSAAAPVARKILQAYFHIK